MREREALEKIFWRNTRPRGKQTVKMERTQPDPRRQIGQLGLFDVMVVQITDDAGDSVIIVHEQTLP